MDYRALAELVMMALMGLSVLAVAVGFSFRLFIAPVVREVLDRLGSGRRDDERLLDSRLTSLEDRLDGIEAGIERLATTQEFDRQLEGPQASGPRLS